MDIIRVHRVFLSCLYSSVPSLRALSHPAASVTRLMDAYLLSATLGCGKVFLKLKASKKRPPSPGASNYCNEQVELLLLRSDRKIVHIQVAAQAFRVTGKDACGVRSCMALCTFRLIFMLGMVTTCAIDCCVLACRLLPCAVNLGVAYSAERRGGVIRISYLQRSVDRMARSAGRNFLPCKMRFMAIEAGRFQSMACVADAACDLGVLAGEFGQLLLRALMALSAGVCQCGAHRDFPGGMGICMTA